MHAIHHFRAHIARPLSVRPGRAPPPRGNPVNSLRVGGRQVMGNPTLFEVHWRRVKECWNKINEDVMRQWRYA